MEDPSTAKSVRACPGLRDWCGRPPHARGLIREVGGGTGHLVGVELVFDEAAKGFDITLPRVGWSGNVVLVEADDDFLPAFRPTFSGLLA